MADVTRASLIAALMDEAPVFSVIEMLDKAGSYATGKPRHPDDYADKLLEHIEGQRAVAARFPDAADPELAAIAAILAALGTLAPCEPEDIRRVLAYVADRHGYVIADED